MQQQPRIQECWDRDLELLISVFKCNYPVQTMTFLRIKWDRWWHDAISDTLSCMLPIKWWTPNKSLAQWCCHFIVSLWYPYLLHGTYQDKCLLPVDCKTSPPKKHTTLTKRTWIWGKVFWGFSTWFNIAQCIKEYLISENLLRFKRLTTHFILLKIYILHC